MRALVDMVDSLTGVVRFIVGAIVLCGFAFAIIMTAGVSYVAPQVSEDVTDKAAAFGEQALAEARQQRREHELAQDGWGYGSAEPVNGETHSKRSSRGDGSAEGWGDAAR